MSKDVKVLLPKLGESIQNATVVQWFKKIGDPVLLDEPLLEVSTDKINSEIPSPVAGVLKQIAAQPDQELDVGGLLGVIAVGESNQLAPSSIERAAPVQELAVGQDNKDFFSPALLRIARENNINLEILSKIPGTGMGGRITKRDLEDYIANRATLKTSPPCPLARPSHNSTSQGEVERLKMSGMRKAIADNMVRSFYEAPHATLVTEVDITSVLDLIQNNKEQILSEKKIKLTLTSFVAHALATALGEYPLLNSSLEGDTILVKKYINIGIAVSIEQGLVVPVIKQSQGKGVLYLAEAIGALSTKARAGKLSLDEMSEGTITLTNFGMSGVQIGIPIIRFPEVAIIGIGAVHKKVVPFENDELRIRSMVNVSLTFDHRVLDGMYGCGFLGSLKKHLEEDLVLN